MLNFLKRKKPPIKYTLFNLPFNGEVGKDSTSFAALDMVCSSFSNLGFDFYSKFTREKTDHQLKELLNDPNIDETKFQFLYNSAKDYYNSGNVYWYKFNMDGEIKSLFRLNPNDILIKRETISNEKKFFYNGMIFNSDTIIHIPSRFGYNGLVGQSIFNTAREVFSTSAVLDEYSKNTFANNVGKRLVIDIGDSQFTQDQLTEFKNEFVRNYGGTENAGKQLISRKNAQFSNVDPGGTDNRALQLEENRKFNEGEISKLFGIPLSMLHGMEGKDIESVYCLFLENAIRPLASSFEQAINKFLLSPLERTSIYFEFNYNNLMKTNLVTRIDSYNKQFMNGILSVNEIREKENLSKNDQAAADTLFIPSNLMPLKDKQIDSLLASAQLKLNELQEKEGSNSSEFHI
jgi:HK97 family phage portal protein